MSLRNLSVTRISLTEPHVSQSTCWILQLQSMYLDDGLAEAFMLLDLARRMWISSREYHPKKRFTPCMSLCEATAVDGKIWKSAQVSLERSAHLQKTHDASRMYEHLLLVAKGSIIGIPMGVEAFGMMLHFFNGMPQKSRDGFLRGEALVDRVLLVHFLAISTLLKPTRMPQHTDLRSCPLGSVLHWISRVCQEVDAMQLDLVQWPLLVAAVRTNQPQDGCISFSDFFGFIRLSPGSFVIDI
jgi:hypothetical protein